MRIKARMVVFVLSVTFAAILAISVHMTKRQSHVTVTWGGPTLCVSERDYFMAQMSDLLEAWSAGRPLSPSRREATDQRLLAIDLEHSMIWLVRFKYNEKSCPV